MIVVVALCTFRSARTTTFASFVLGDSPKSMAYFIFLMTFFLVSGTSDSHKSSKVTC